MITAAGILALLIAAGAGPARAAARMDSPSYVLRPSADQSGGGEGAVSASDYRLGGSVGEVGSAMASASDYRLASGSRRLLHYPNVITGLTALAGISESSVTLQWSAPGHDGALGRLQPGASYFIVISSDPDPTEFVFSNASGLDASVRVATHGVGGLGVPPGTTDSAPAQALVPNTTWFAEIWALDTDGNLSFASPRSTFTSLARKVTLLAQPIFDVGDTSITLSWAALPLSPPDASSMTAEGYLIEASSTDFGVLFPGGVVISSMTQDVLVSTLAVGADTPLEYCTTYYFRVGSLNWIGSTNYMTIDPYPTYDDDATETSTHLLDLGPQLLAQESVIPTGIVVTNTGRCPATYSLSATTVTTDSPWQVFAGPGLDRFSLIAGFNATEPAPVDFGAEDFLSDSRVPATASVFAIGQNGYRVPRGELRTLWLKLKTPLVSSTEAEQDIRVTVTAVRDPP
ncbi:MAG: hypothetical protein HY928_08510 [Elusimicrobia bacterium]|nr:hypothetical protein [Elusimicrobiota bacterium]